MLASSSSGFSHDAGDVEHIGRIAIARRRVVGRQLVQRALDLEQQDRRMRRRECGRHARCASVDRACGSMPAQVVRLPVVAPPLGLRRVEQALHLRVRPARHDVGHRLAQACAAAPPAPRRPRCCPLWQTKIATIGLPCTSFGSHGAGGAMRSTATLVSLARRLGAELAVGVEHLLARPRRARRSRRRGSRGRPGRAGTRRT